MIRKKQLKNPKLVENFLIGCAWNKTILSRVMPARLLLNRGEVSTLIPQQVKKQHWCEIYTEISIICDSWYRHTSRKHANTQLIYPRGIFRFHYVSSEKYFRYFWFPELTVNKNFSKRGKRRLKVPKQFSFLNKCIKATKGWVRITCTLTERLRY